MKRLIGIYLLVCALIMVGYGLLAHWLEQDIIAYHEAMFNDQSEINAAVELYDRQTRLLGGLLGLTLVVVGTLFYVTRQRTLERLMAQRTAELRRAERHYRELFEGIDDAVFVYDAAGDILEVNEVACRRLGYDRDGLLTINMDDIREADSAPSSAAILTRLQTEQRLSIECVHRARDGRRIFTDANITLISYQGHTAALSVCRDVTGRRQAEMAVREGEARLRAIVEHTSDGIFIKDRAGRYLLLNAASARHLGRPVEALIGLRDADLPAPDRLDEASDVDARVIASGRPITYERRRTMPGGERVFLITKFPYLGPEGEVLGVVGVSRDVTEDSLAEEELLRLSRELAYHNATLHALHDMGVEINANPLMSELPGRILERVTRLLNADGGTILLYDPDLAALRVIAGSGIGDTHVGRTVAPGEGVGGRVFETNQAIIVADYATWEGRSPRYADEPIKAFLSVPLRRRGEVLGALNVVTGPEGRTFQPEDIQLAEMVANQAAVAIENARLIEAERRQREIAETLREIGLVLTGTLRQEDVLQCILEQVARVLPYDTASVWLRADDGRYRTVAMVGYERFGVADDAARITWAQEEPATLRYIRETRQPLIIPDVREYAGWVPAAGFEWLRSWAGAPILARGQVIGAFAIDHTQPGFYGPQVEPILQALAAQISVAVESASLFEQVQQHAANLEAEVAARTAEIRHEQERIATILRHIGDAVVITDLQGRITYVNEAFHRLLGWPAEEVVGQTTALFSPDSDDGEALQEFIRTLSADRVWRGVLPWRHHDGGLVEVEITGVPYGEDEGVVTGFFASLRNLSAERVLERMKAQFMHLVSHELRTPLTNLKLRLHLLRQTGGDPQRAPKHLDALENQTDQLIDLMEKVLIATRLTDAETLAASGSINGLTLLENIRVRFGGVAEGMAVTLDVRPLSASPSLLTGNETWLTYACYELVENALRYTPAGGRVTVSLDEAQQDGRRYLVFAVHDSGPGINEHDLADLRGAFIRTGPQRSGTSAGMGLGLFIARTVAERQGGRLTVESEVDAGSTFALWLPLPD